MKKVNLGLIGWPVEHSVSPQLQEGALRSVGLDGQYQLYPVAPLPAGEADFDALLDRLRSGSLHGLNVTIPHKQTAYRKVEALTGTAQAVGAVNTIYDEEGVLWGDNTDVGGFLQDLLELAAHPRRVLVLGAGGAARAVVYGLITRGAAEIYIAARRLTQAEDLVAALGQVVTKSFPQAGRPDIDRRSARLVPLVINPGSLTGIMRGIDLVVNTTPVGMVPKVDRSPWPTRLNWPAGAAAYDLVYNPAETLFLQTARAAGAPVRGGIGMLIEQAALAFERWTGANPSREIMRASLPGSDAALA